MSGHKSAFTPRMKMSKEGLSKHNKICRLYETGSSIKEIAKETGYKESTVKQLLCRYGVYEFKKASNKLDEMINMRKAGKTLKEIAEATGFHYSTVSVELVKHGKRKGITFGEPEIDESKLTYAKPRKEPERITHTDETFPCDVWQQYASPVWMDIKQSDTLQRKSARDEKDERHICPLQLEVIKRGIELWTNPGDIVFDPFMGIGSSPYVAVRLGRRGTGIELKESYYTQAENNLKIAALEDNAPSIVGQMSIFDFPEVMP